MLTLVMKFGGTAVGNAEAHGQAAEIVKTQAQRCRKQDALRFGLSDKPNEASLPTAALAGQDYLPIHQLKTDVVGEGGA
jgi:hypothetical protein